MVRVGRKGGKRRSDANTWFSIFKRKRCHNQDMEIWQPEPDVPKGLELSIGTLSNSRQEGLSRNTGRGSLVGFMSHPHYTDEKVKPRG